MRFSKESARAAKVMYQAIRADFDGNLRPQDIYAFCVAKTLATPKEMTFAEISAAVDADAAAAAQKEEDEKAIREKKTGRVEIANEKAAGTFAVGYKYQVLDIHVTDGVAMVSYTETSTEYRPGKMCRATAYVAADAYTAYVGSGYGNADYFISETEKIENCRRVEGKTYALKHRLQAWGFTWERSEKCWVKKTE